MALSRESAGEDPRRPQWPFNPVCEFIGLNWIFVVLAVIINYPIHSFAHSVICRTNTTRSEAELAASAVWHRHNQEANIPVSVSWSTVGTVPSRSYC